MLLKSQAVLRSRVGVSAIAVILLALVGALFVSMSTSTTAESNPPFARYDDKHSDYGVCMGLNASYCYNDHWTPAFKNNAVPRVLVYSKTGPRHAHLGPALQPGLNPPLTAANIAHNAVIEWGEEFGFEVDWTEDVSQLGNPGTLRRYNALIFLSTSREVLDDPSRTALRQYIRSGGGFVSIHNTLGAEYNWDYFQGLNGGANFYDHGPNRNGTVVTVSKKDASTKNLPARWEFRDEWYNLEPEPSHLVRILAKVDTDTLNPVGGGTHPGHAGNHPVSWCHYFDGGKSWVTSLGHNSGHWNGTLDGHEYFKEHTVKGILSVIGLEPFCQ
jgi:uncharacterized protein